MCLARGSNLVRSTALMMALGLCTVRGAVAQEVRPAAWFGGGYWAGHVTYQIGQQAIENGQVIALPDPLSELEWPVDSAAAAGGLTLPLGTRGEFYLNGWMNVTDPDQPVVDSDWLEQDVLYIRSESDAALDAYTILSGLRAWTQPLGGGLAAGTIRLGAGVGLLYQSFEWEASNLDQGYPIAPAAPHDYVPGVVGTYEAEVTMPFIEGTLRVSGDRFRLLLTAGFAPYAQVSDRDDHLLRYIVAETEATGIGGLGALEAELDLSETVFVNLRVDAVAFVADGTEHNLVYGGPDAGDTWTIEHEVFSVQAATTLGLGLRF